MHWVETKSLSGDDYLKWTYPYNVIMVEVTNSAPTSIMCHGAGIKSKTLSDLVHAMKFVNANGDV
jgi:hypothetical protein